MKTRLRVAIRKKASFCVCIIIVVVLLTACGISGTEPSRQIVQQGLAKFNAIVAFQLGCIELQAARLADCPSFKIKRLVITEHHPLVIQTLPAYRVSGTYDLIIQLPKRRVIRQQNPFSIYLQRQKEGKTWRLALPQTSNGNLSWRIYSLLQ